MKRKNMPHLNDLREFNNTLPNIAQFPSLRIRRTTSLNFNNFAILRILRHQNCEMFGQVLHAQLKIQDSTVVSSN